MVLPDVITGITRDFVYSVMEASSSQAGPSKLLEKLGHILLDSSRALAENQSREVKVGHRRIPVINSQKYHSLDPGEIVDADHDETDLETSDYGEPRTG